MYVPGPQLPYDPTVGWKSKPHVPASSKKASFNKWIWIGLVILLGISWLFFPGRGNEEPQELPIPERVVPAP